MITGLITLLIAIAVIVGLFAVSKNRNNFAIALLSVTFIVTIGLCFAKPIQHKPFSIDVIDYFIKFNDDGSVTTTKQTTTTKLQEKTN